MWTAGRNLAREQSVTYKTSVIVQSIKDINCIQKKTYAAYCIRSYSTVVFTRVENRELPSSQTRIYTML